MTRADFIAQLRKALTGLAPQYIDEIVADYEAHFSEGLAAGRSEADVAQALGDPQRLGRELRAEKGLRRWETERSPSALIGAIAALGGMLALDILILLPFLSVVVFTAIILGIVFFAVGIAGLGLLLSSLFHWHAGFAGVLSRILAGIGLFGGGVGFGALLYLALEWLVKLLGGYARLHYRVLKTTEQGT